MSNWDKNIVGMLLILLGIGMTYQSAQIIHGEVPYPKDCHYKRVLCELENLIFEQGGYFAVGMENMAFGLLIALIGYVALTSEA